LLRYQFSYDAVGNIVAETVEPNLATLLPANTEMSYGLANRLATVDQQNITLDADGNMVEGLLQGELTQFSFDSRNRLTQAGNTQYQYDAENQRIAVNDTQYVINSQPSLSQALVRTKGNGEVTYYVYGLGLIGEESAGNYFSYHFDYRGSTIAITNITGQLLDSVQYSPFGIVLSQPTFDTPFLFNGLYGVMTDGNRLNYMRARYYSAEIRRFVNQDVLLGNVADGQSLNRYIFVKGKPAQYTDPFGLFSTEDGFSVAIDFIPIAGSCKGVAEFVLGKDPITGEPIPRWMAAVGILPFGKYFTRGSKVTYEIIDGVRRAKATEMMGQKTITANILNESSEIVDIVEIPLSSLYSPNKLSIDFYTDIGKDRFMKIVDEVKSGSTMPIDVKHGCKGPKLCDVIVDIYGDS
jgi:RHS repeat-associated protein